MNCILATTLLGSHAMTYLTVASLMKAPGTNITHKLIDVSLLMTTFLLVLLDVIVSLPTIMRYFPRLCFEIAQTRIARC
jgi:hypothetical protein